MKKDFFLTIQPRISLLDDEHKEEIHRASLEILERTGILVHDQEALDLLQQAGCSVRENNRVFLPGPVVEEAIRTVPDRITISNRKGERCLYLEDRKAYFGTGSETLNVIDVRTGERRKAILNDVREAARLCDRLKNVDFVMSMGMADDIPAVLSDRYQFEAMVSSTIKPIMFTAWDKEGLEDIYRMALAVAGNEKNLQQNPFLINYSEPIAPFVHPKDSLQKLLFCAEKGIPVEYHCISMAGATGPATLAGSFVQANARMLSGMVIHQLKKKGAPLIVQSPVIYLDMRTSLMPYFGPEWCLSTLMSKEMALYYGVPTFGKAGATDAKLIDQQAGIEIGMSIFAEGLVGNNLIHDIGYLETGLTSSLASIAICDEVIGHVKSFLKGIAFSPEHLAIDLINELGPKGNYMNTEHTLKHFRQEAWFAKLIDHSRYDNWVASGSKTMLDGANEMVKSMLATHEVPPLPIEVTNEMKAILQKSKEKLNKK